MINDIYFYSIYFLFFITILICILIWNSELHKSLKYQQFLQLLAGLTVLFTSFAIIIQLYTFTSTQADTEVQIYQDMFNNLIGNTIEYFENNPKMNYFYNQLFQPLNYNPNATIKKRYYSEEQQLIHSVLQKLSSIVYYLQTDRTLDGNTKKNIEIKIKLFFNNFKNSSIFLENYYNMKEHLFSPTIKEYLKLNFNI
jgi:hypothetical protein